MRIDRQHNHLRTFLELFDEYLRTLQNPMNIFAAFLRVAECCDVSSGYCSSQCNALEQSSWTVLRNRNSSHCAVAHFDYGCGMQERRGSERDGLGSWMPSRQSLRGELRPQRTPPDQ